MYVFALFTDIPAPTAAAAIMDVCSLQFYNFITHKLFGLILESGFSILADSSHHSYFDWTKLKESNFLILTFQFKWSKLKEPNFYP